MVSPDVSRRDWILQVSLEFPLWRFSHVLGACCCRLFHAWCLCLVLLLSFPFCPWALFVLARLGDGFGRATHRSLLGGLWRAMCSGGTCAGHLLSLARRCRGGIRMTGLICVSDGSNWSSEAYWCTILGISEDLLVKYRRIYKGVCTWDD